MVSPSALLRTAPYHSNIWPNTPAHSPTSFPNTAHAAPGMRTHRLALCMSGRSWICAAMARKKCARWQKKLLNWYVATKALIAASTVTACAVANGLAGNLVRRLPMPCVRSNMHLIQMVYSIRERSLIRRRWMIRVTFAFHPNTKSFHSRPI